MPLSVHCLRSKSIRMVACSVGLHKSSHLCPRDVARLCVGQFLAIRIVRSIIPLSGHYLRSESKRMVASSVGLRRSEIDGYLDIHLCGRDVARSLCCLVSDNSDRKFDHPIVRPLVAIRIIATWETIRSGYIKVAISVPEMKPDFVLTSF